MAEGIWIERTTGEDERFTGLERQLDDFLTALNGEMDEFFSAQNHAVPLQTVVVAGRGQTAMACGAFRPKEPGVVEIKRMYVLPEARGERIAERVLAELLAWSGELGYREAVLETHFDLSAARRLYERNGFELIPNYPPYENILTSICYRRPI